ncbi:MAG: acyl-CoA/acyl-ACP dehydrogenase [Actinomycetota bacterium]|nr:acyl-CoA/acyl-ACP dehydrogenase [Actinomycetota bacterium]
MSSEGVIASIHEVALGPIAANAGAVDRERKFPHESIKALADAGALGLLVPDRHGGTGGSLTNLAEACEAIATSCASSAMVFLMHSVTAATLAAGGGTKASEALDSFARGETIGTLAFSERETGAHFYAPALKAERRNGSVTVSGSKSFVTSGGQAQYLLLLVQSPEEGADAYLVERDADGVEFEGRWNGLGMAGNSSIGMKLSNVTLGKDALVGKPGSAAELVFGVVAPYFLIGLAAVNVGIAAGALSTAVEHVTNRRYPDGGRLAEVQYIQHLLADMDMRTRSARLMVREAARLGDDADPGALVPIMECKVVATEAAALVTEDALKATGGRGYTPDLPVERYLRDARAGAVMAPTNAVLRNWIGKALAGLPVP